jgi:hypothetical protein
MKKKTFMGAKRLKRLQQLDPKELERRRDELTKLLQRLSLEVDDLVALGEWNRSHYERLLNEVLSEAKRLELPLTDRLGFLYENTEPEWLEV